MDSLDGKKTAQLKWTKIELEETEDEVSVVPITRRDSYFTDTPTSVSSLQESISRVFGTGRMISTESFVKVEKKGKNYRRYSHEPSLLTEQQHGCESQDMKVYFLESPHGSSDGLDSIGEESVDSARETSLSSGSENDMKDLKHVPERRFQHQLPRKEEHTYQNIREISKQRLIEQWVQSQSDCTKSSESKGITSFTKWWSRWVKCPSTNGLALFAGGHTWLSLEDWFWCRIVDLPSVLLSDTTYPDKSMWALSVRWKPDLLLLTAK